jgi:hypothetical protein
MAWSPAFVDPVLEYLRSTLPPPIYNLLLTFLAHSLALLTAFTALFSSLLSTNPWQWDAQTVLPPLISLLAAYLALVSVYRTTTWAIRTSVWFVKWAAIVAVLMGGAGWIVNASNALMSPGAAGLIPGLRDMVMDMVNGQGRGSTGRSRRSRTNRKAPQQSRPKPWDSFERHQEWREQQGADQQGDALKYVADVVDAASRAVGGSAWWQVVKSVVDGTRKEAEDPIGKGTRTRRGKTAAATGKSTRPR